MSENKLGSEKSAYLLQHAENPIAWWPYSTEALETAKRLNRPIFLSIGYSSCHWCHVMAHESFEDQATADYINKKFVCIKVDREEHPHIDQLYQNISAAATGRGGWPLSVFLTPNQAPIFVGTYFPKQARQGMPSFMEVLNHIQKTYAENSAQTEEQGQNLMREIAKPITVDRTVKFEGHFPPPAAIMNALQNYADTTHGGYGQAPKFPHFAFLEWGAEQILEGMIPQEQGQHIVNSIEKMLMGGMYDHLRGGIHRYAVDAGWLVPHFEKMLYDQSGLLRVLAKSSAFYPSPLFFDGILQTLDYLENEMVCEENYLMAAQDADSEGHEGLYFTFTKQEFVDALKDAEEEVGPYKAEWENWFRITEKGNFENGLNVISLDPALKESYYSPEGWEQVRKVRQALMHVRKQRIPPATDFKGVASWNFMLLASLCDVIQYCRVPSIAQQAIQLLNRVNDGVAKVFLKTESGGRQVFRHTNTTEAVPLCLEDFVAFAECQLRLHEVTGAAVFLTNVKETLIFIRREFFHDGTPMMIAGQTGGEWRAALNDQSFRSPVATLMNITARVSVIFPEFHPETYWGKNWTEWTQLSLLNPLGHGEAIRAYTYPLEIIRKIEVPRAWVNEARFQNLRSHFLGRFVLTYHDRGDEWQVCTRQSCEKQGKGLESILETFRPVDEEQA